MLSVSEDLCCVTTYTVSKFVTFMTPLVFFKKISLVLLRTWFSQCCIKLEEASYNEEKICLCFFTRRRRTIMSSYAKYHEHKMLSLCPVQSKIWIFIEICLATESNTPAKDPKAMIFRKFSTGDCPNSVKLEPAFACWYFRHVHLVKASLCIHE